MRAHRLGWKKKGATFNSKITSQSGWGSLGPRVYEGLARAWASLLAHLPLWYFPATAWLLEVLVKVAQSCPTLCNPVDCNSLGQNTGVGSLSLLQGIFPIQASNPGLPHCRRILYQLSYRGSKGGTSSWDKVGQHGNSHLHPLWWSTVKSQPRHEFERHVLRP